MNTISFITTATHISQLKRIRSTVQLAFVLSLSWAASAADIGTRAEADGSYNRHEQSLTIVPPIPGTNATLGLAPQSCIIEAVREAASKRWAAFAIGKPIACCDIAGQLICYQVPVLLGTNVFPNILTAPPALEVRIDDLHNAQLWGANDYWTFTVAAHTNHYPIPHFGPGLPPLLVTHHKAAELAKQLLSAKAPLLTRYYALAPTEQFYQFDSPSGSNLVLNARTLSICDFSAARRVGAGPALSITETENIRSLQDEQQRQAQKAWDAIRDTIKHD